MAALSEPSAAMIAGLPTELPCQTASAGVKALHCSETLGELRDRAVQHGEANHTCCGVVAVPAEDVESDSSTESGGEEVHSEPEDDDFRGGTSPPLADALFIFDWDDTIFPTSWLQLEGIQPDGRGFTHQGQKVQFRKVAQSAAALLEAAKRLGHVIIVTNAEAGWIQQCCTQLLPELAPAIDGVKCVSARSESSSSEAEPSEWKCQAFDREIQSFCAGRTGGAGAAGSALQVISLGDSMYEQSALFSVARTMPVFRPKSVKLMEHPTAEQLVEQHELLFSNLEDLFEQEGELDIEVGAEQTAP